MIHNVQASARIAAARQELLEASVHARDRQVLTSGHRGEDHLAWLLEGCKAAGAEGIG
jgi:hypothetical protein